MRRLRADTLTGSNPRRLARRRETKKPPGGGFPVRREIDYFDAADAAPEAAGAAIEAEAAAEAVSAAAEAAGAGAGAGAAAGAGAGAGAGSSFLPQADRAAAAIRVARTSDFFISNVP
jgi:hypothetical protein